VSIKMVAAILALGFLLSCSNPDFRRYGCVVLRDFPDGPRILLKYNHDWSAPRGTREQGESPIETAERETLEETTAIITATRELVRFIDCDGAEVLLFLADYVDGQFDKIGVAYINNGEVKMAAFLPLQEAKLLIRREHLAIFDALPQ
jgi:8-oxo-dGTP pyrophosphatase MutT (NUDIX family)